MTAYIHPDCLARHTDYVQCHQCIDLAWSQRESLVRLPVDWTRHSHQNPMRLPLVKSELDEVRAGNLVALAGDTFPDWLGRVDSVDAEECRVTVTVLLREARREPMVHPECREEHQPGVQCPRCLGYFLRYATP